MTKAKSEKEVVLEVDIPQISKKKAEKARDEYLSLLAEETRNLEVLKRVQDMAITPIREKKKELFKVIERYVRQESGSFPNEEGKRSFEWGDAIVRIEPVPEIKYCADFEKQPALFLSMVKKYPKVILGWKPDMKYINAKLQEGDEVFRSFIEEVDRSEYEVRIIPAVKEKE
ncbi:MAG: hypothetical protein NW226_17645 [Microscillaceae bacterium]|nr:hypothetical protein [Microscillaceae bacterium]